MFRGPYMVPLKGLYSLQKGNVWEYKKIFWYFNAGEVLTVYPVFINYFRVIFFVFPEGNIMSVIMKQDGKGCTPASCT